MIDYMLSREEWNQAISIIGLGYGIITKAAFGVYIDSLKRHDEALRADHDKWRDEARMVQQRYDNLSASVKGTEAALDAMRLEQDEARATLKEHEDECWCFNPEHGDLRASLAEQETGIRALLTANEMLRTELATVRRNLEAETKRLDWLDNFVQHQGVFESCFEIDGGVHVTLYPVAGPESGIAFRNKNDIREAIDTALAS